MRERRRGRKRDKHERSRWFPMTKTFRARAFPRMTRAISHPRECITYIRFYVPTRKRKTLLRAMKISLAYGTEYKWKESGRAQKAAFCFAECLRVALSIVVVFFLIAGSGFSSAHARTCVRELQLWYTRASSC